MIRWTPRGALRKASLSGGNFRDGWFENTFREIFWWLVKDEEHLMKHLGKTTTDTNDSESTPLKNSRDNE